MIKKVVTKEIFVFFIFLLYNKTNNSFLISKKKLNFLKITERRSIIIKKKLFFVLLLSGSMFLNFNIADAKGSTEVTTFSQYTIIANDGGGSPLESTINW